MSVQHSGMFRIPAAKFLTVHTHVASSIYAILLQRRILSSGRPYSSINRLEVSSNPSSDKIHGDSTVRNLFVVMFLFFISYDFKYTIVKNKAQLINVELEVRMELN